MAETAPLFTVRELRRHGEQVWGVYCRDCFLLWLPDGMAARRLAAMLNLRIQRVLLECFDPSRPAAGE